MLICGSDNRIIGNTIHGAGRGPANDSYRGGINLALSCSGVPANANQIRNSTITGVVSSGAQEGCIALSLPGRGRADGNTVTGNSCYDNSADIINNQVGSNTVENNHCSGAGCSTAGGAQFAAATDADACPAGATPTPGTPPRPRLPAPTNVRLLHRQPP